MKTRLISLLLCLVMVLAVLLTGCAEKTDDQAKEEITTDASQNAMTLTMWVVAEEKPSADAYNRISALVNSVTKSKFKAQVILNYFTKDEYRAELEKTMTAFEAVKQNIEVTEEEDEKEVVSDEYVTNQQGLEVIKYPEALQNQVDIIYIAGEDMYFDYINEGRLVSLNDELASSSKKLKEYVSPTLLSAAQVKGITYAIPNNRPIGEYTYMLLNKDLMKEYAQDAYVKLGMVDGLFSENLYQFFDLVATKDNVVKINYSYEECLAMLAHYWNISSEDYSILQDFSAFGYYYENIEDLSRGSVLLGYESLFANENFVKDYLKLNEYRFKGYLQSGEVAEGAQVAAKFIKGDTSICENKDSEGVTVYRDSDGVEYYPVIVGYPTATSEDIYGNMFGVYKYTRSVSRSMQVITYLNTNADFRNLLQYGEENVDYQVVRDEEGNFRKINYLDTGYRMDIWATGNTFIAYPDPTATTTDSKPGSVMIWENGKKQNQDSLVYPLLGFNLKDTATSDLFATDDELAGKYDVAFKTGLDKTLLTQDAEIAKWLENADAAKGVYVLKTTKVGDSYTTINYYVYNNDIGNGVLATAKAVENMQYNEKTGKDMLANVTFTVDYESKAGASAYGYELSCVTVRATESVAEMALFQATRDGAAIASNIKSIAAFVPFDFYHTASYDVEIYDEMTWPEVRKNYIMDEWLRASMPPSRGQNDPKTHLLTYQGENEYTFVVYRNKLTKVNVLDVEMIGAADKVVLNVSIQQDDKGETIDETYKLCYISVKTASSDVKVEFNYTFNGKAVSLAEFDSHTEATVNPNFEKIGTMDTETVKFIERLNAALLAELNACYEEGMAAINAAETPEAKAAATQAAIAAYSALVADISKLMDASVEEDDAVDFNEKNYPTLAKINPDFLKNIGILDHGMSDSAKVRFLEYIRSAVSYEIITKPQVPSEQGMIDQMYSPYTNIREDYVYYESPYGIYYAWLKNYKYLPKETQ